MVDYSAWSAEASAYTEAGSLPPPVEGIPSFADRTHTVSASATGTGNGTDANPWTLSQAMANCQPGMIIGIKAGVYIGTGTPDRIKPAFAPARSGTAENPIYFVAEYLAALTDSLPYSDIRSGATVVNSGWPAFGVNTKDYVFFIGLYSDLNDDNNKLTPDSGLGMSNGSKYCAFLYCKFIGDPEDCKAANNNLSGIRNGGDENITVANCYFRDFTGFTNSAGLLSYRVRNLTVEHCEFYNCRNAMQPKGGYEGDPRPGGFTGLIVRYNYSSGGYCFMRPHSTVALTPEDEYHIYCNVSDRDTHFIEQATSNTGHAGGGNSDVWYGINVYNNVSIRSKSELGHIRFDVRPFEKVVPFQRECRFFNNVCYGTSNALIGTYQFPTADWELLFSTVDYGVYNNLWRHVDGSGANFTLDDWRALGKDLNSVVAAPNLDADFRPLPGSPCIGQGRDLLGTFGPVNGVVDAGCYPTGTETIGIVNG